MMRTKAVAHYIISQAPPHQLGATKLRKVMWAADVAFYRQFGRTITGQDSYLRMPYGPVPNGLAEAIHELETERKVAVYSVPTWAGHRTEYAPLERLGATEFGADEIGAIHFRHRHHLPAERLGDERGNLHAVVAEHRQRHADAGSRRRGHRRRADARRDRMDA